MTEKKATAAKQREREERQREIESREHGVLLAFVVDHSDNDNTNKFVLLHCDPQNMCAQATKHAKSSAINRARKNRAPKQHIPGELKMRRWRSLPHQNQRRATSRDVNLCASFYVAAVVLAHVGPCHDK